MQVTLSKTGLILIYCEVAGVAYGGWIGIFGNFFCELF